MDEPWEPGFPRYDAWESREAERYWRDRARSMSDERFRQLESSGPRSTQPGSEARGQRFGRPKQLRYRFCG